MAATLDHGFDDRKFVLRPHGAWVIEDAALLEGAIDEATGALIRAPRDALVIDLRDVERLDTAGAYFLVRLERAWKAGGQDVLWQGDEKGRLSLINRVRDAVSTDLPPGKPRRESMFEEIGETVLGVGADFKAIQAMLGAVVIEIASSVTKPSNIRPIAILRQMEMTGVRSVPIIMLMSFLIGGIVAQQGAFQLRYFGAEIFAVNLLGILALRELSTLLTAIMVAGRSGSAITAELGSMEMREEIDALRVIGLEPINVLVVPRVLALILVLPLLTFISGLFALLGGMVTLWLYSGIPPDFFLVRLREGIDFSSFFSGLIKAPFMALIIGLIACAEGMAVRGSAESLGRHTTAAVVKAIFMVIVVDGIFAVFFASIDF